MHTDDSNPVAVSVTTRSHSNSVPVDMSVTTRSLAHAVPVATSVTTRSHSPSSVPIRDIRG
jgi:hypothetical protein